ncbi:MAG: RNA methyltransferase [Myxococcota bacterium]|nr:RNA methyltransferase [Myxococcota bacterium]
MSGPVPVIEIATAEDPRVSGYLDLRDAQLSRRQGLFVIEGRQTLRTVFEGRRFQPQSFLLSHATWRALEAEIASYSPDTPVYRAETEILAAIAGFPIHRGCLALVRRPPPISVEELLRTSAPKMGPSRLLVLEGLTNHDNVGAAFRNAMAFGVDAIVLCPRCCDPLYRKAIRTSLGGSLRVPFARAENWPEDLDPLQSAGYRLVALDPDGEDTLHGSSASVGDRLAIIVGTEGPGLSEKVRERADHGVKIEMAPGIDSINVATAAAIALHHYGPRRRQEG